MHKVDTGRNGVLARSYKSFARLIIIYLATFMTIIAIEDLGFDIEIEI